jgi:dTDP-4-dehydrorhamnose reductase
MRVLILGATGMLGHMLWQVLHHRFDTWATIRGTPASLARYGTLFDPYRIIGGVDARSFPTVIRAFATVRPEVVINCIGIIKQVREAQEPIPSLQVNALFPHLLADLCAAAGARLVHISTDCIFSGRKGMYTETDMPDPEDLYGRSKLLGEVNGLDCLTLRTSIIGRELGTTYGLVEWFLSHQGGQVQGYTRAIYSGFPTLIFAQIVAKVLQEYPTLSGLYHVSSEPISKYALLCLLREAYGVPVEIEPFPDVCIDRSLDSSRFRAATNFMPQPWPEMVHTMAHEAIPYDRWR